MFPSHVHVKAGNITCKITPKKEWKKTTILGNACPRIGKADTASEREDVFL